MNTRLGFPRIAYARDGSGNYSRTHADYVDGTTVEADDVNGELNDIASALTQSISKDGQTTYTASQPMGGFKLTGLGNGTGSGESIRYDEFKMAFRGHLAGLQMTSRTNTTIVYGAGSWAEDAHARVFAHAGGTINCATTGALGLDAGSLANNTWYHAFAIAQTDGTTSLLASTSVSAPTMPGSYTLQRRIGSFRTNGSAQIIDFVQTGDLFQWAVQVLDQSSVNFGTGGSAGSDLTLSVPTGVAVRWRGNVTGFTSGAAGGWNITLKTPGTTVAGAQTVNGFSAGGAGDNGQSSCFAEILTNTSGQVTAVVSASAANTFLSMSTAGWIDRRGRDA